MNVASEIIVLGSFIQVALTGDIRGVFKKITGFFKKISLVVLVRSVPFIRCCVGIHVHS